MIEKWNECHRLVMTLKLQPQALEVVSNPPAIFYQTRKLETRVHWY